MAPLQRAAPHQTIPRIIAVFVLLVIRLVSAHCFLPNGTDRNVNGIDAYQPSGAGSSTDDFQMCCATYRQNGQTPDVPRKDGLCTFEPSDQVWRESCTDPTWESPSCIKLCIDGTDENGQPMKDNDELVTPCPDLSYCCGYNNTACCERGDGVWIRDGVNTTVNPNSTETNPGAAITTTATPPDTPSSPSNSGGLSGGAIAGIAVSGALGAAILGLGLWFLARRKKRATRKLHNEVAMDQVIQVSEKDGNAVPYPSELQDTGPVLELQHTSGRIELAGSFSPREME